MVVQNATTTGCFRNVVSSRLIEVNSISKATSRRPEYILTTDNPFQNTGKTKHINPNFSDQKKNRPKKQHKDLASILYNIIIWHIPGDSLWPFVGWLGDKMIKRVTDWNTDLVYYSFTQFFLEDSCHTGATCHNLPTLRPPVGWEERWQPKSSRRGSKMEEMNGSDHLICMWFSKM